MFGELSACMPTVFPWQWPNNIRTQLISNENTEGTITNSDLEMAGLLLLWLTMEGVCSPLQEKRVAMFRDNSPSISWAKRLASKQSLAAENLVEALALQLKIQQACPLCWRSLFSILVLILTLVSAGRPGRDAESV